VSANRLTAAEAKRLQQCLAGDGVAVIPTDTVYGLACNPQSQTALRRIYELKQRPPRKPAAVIFFTLQTALETLGELGERTRSALAALLPGPITLLLENRAGRYPLACATEGDTPAALGLRVPLLNETLTALAAVTVPGAQSSANLSGQPDSRRLADVPAAIRCGADLLLDGGELPGVASTVLDLRDYERSGSWSVVRAGPLEQPQIEEMLRSSAS
jgi:L-threonylcarbamoyladenylate synthase